MKRFTETSDGYLLEWPREKRPRMVIRMYRKERVFTTVMPIRQQEQYTGRFVKL